MLCPECNGRLSVQSTIPWEGATWRARKCPDCGAVKPTVERFAEWPAGIFSLSAKAKRRPTLAARRPDLFAASAGADLASVMAAFTRPVASAQQLDPN